MQMMDVVQPNPSPVRRRACLWKQDAHAAGQTTRAVLRDAQIVGQNASAARRNIHVGLLHAYVVLPHGCSAVKHQQGQQQTK